MTGLTLPTPALRRGLQSAVRFGGRTTPSGVRAAMAVLFMLVLPVALAVQSHFGRIWDWDYYGGDARERAVLFAHREAVLALAERASHLQSSKGEEVRYRWTEQAGEAAAGYVETQRGYLPLATQRFGVYSGRELSAGLVENGQGAVMMQMTGIARGECTRIHLWMSDYTKARATGAFLPKAMPLDDTKDAVSKARWEPLEAAMERCKSAGYETPGTLLMRFDGFLSNAEGKAP